MWKESRLTQINCTGEKPENVNRPPGNATGLASIAIIARRGRGEQIHQAESADEYWYRVMSGAAKCYVVLPGGRRQIIDLLLQNDFFCFTPRDGDYHALEAVVNGTVVACYPRRRAESLAQSDPNVRQEIHQLTAEAAARLQQQVLILGRVTAREKVGSFLLRMMERSATQNSGPLSLVVSRYDIADYLALSVETVSRSLTELKHRGLIALSGPRRVEIVNRDGLEDGELFHELCVTHGAGPRPAGSIRRHCRATPDGSHPPTLTARQL